jgi:hypothetical protein
MTVTPILMGGISLLIMMKENKILIEEVEAV